MAYHPTNQNTIPIESTINPAITVLLSPNIMKDEMAKMTPQIIFNTENPVFINLNNYSANLLLPLGKKHPINRVFCTNCGNKIILMSVEGRRLNCKEAEKSYDSNLFCRDETTRTSDLHVPNVAR